MKKILSFVFAAMFAATTADATVMINEFDPNPPGSESSFNVELIGPVGDSFSGHILSTETDNVSSVGDIQYSQSISGTFDANGLISVSLPDIENPSFSLFLVDTYTGGSELDSLDDLATAGITTVLDAINIPDASGDESNSVAASLFGGTDFSHTGDEPKLVFRETTTGTWIAVNDPSGGTYIDAAGNTYTAADFDIDPENATFGFVNPSFVPEPSTVAMLMLGAVAASAASMRSRLG